MRELYRDARDPEHRQRAENAITSMLSWSFGLRKMGTQHPPPLPPNVEDPKIAENKPPTGDDEVTAQDQFVDSAPS